MSNAVLIAFLLVLSVAVSVGTVAGIRLINAIVRSYLDTEIKSASTIAVTYIQRVYVNKAKANRSFESGGRNQKEALHLAVKCTRSLLSPTADRYLSRGRTDAEVNDYLIALVEKAVADAKNKGDHAGKYY